MTLAESLPLKTNRNAGIGPIPPWDRHHLAHYEETDRALRHERLRRLLQLTIEAMASRNLYAVLDYIEKVAREARLPVVFNFRKCKPPSMCWKKHSGARSWPSAHRANWARLWAWSAPFWGRPRIAWEQPTWIWRLRERRGRLTSPRSSRAFEHRSRDLKPGLRGSARRWPVRRGLGRARLQSRFLGCLMPASDGLVARTHPRQPVPARLAPAPGAAPPGPT